MLGSADTQNTISALEENIKERKQKYAKLKGRSKELKTNVEELHAQQSNAVEESTQLKLLLESETKECDRLRVAMQHLHTEGPNFIMTLN